MIAKKYAIDENKTEKALKLVETLKYDDNGLIPAIVQDEKTKDVLMVAYMNRASLEKTLKEGKATY